mmetsp:Transcript_39797/g.55267  ORF Transcript_39797/g.55267 Transcript_39797/m.55267 type:complete len:105 (-) Transcript_39797:301-615(-)
MIMYPSNNIQDLNELSQNLLNNETEDYTNPPRPLTRKSSLKHIDSHSLYKNVTFCDEQGGILEEIREIPPRTKAVVAWKASLFAVAVVVIFYLWAMQHITNQRP